MQEYVDFLGKQPPYDRLDSDDLEALARHVEVEYFAAGSTIVRAEGARLDHLYVVRTGAAHVMDRGRIVDELVPGDTFGYISVLSGLPPPVSVTAFQDTLCYRLPNPRDVIKHSERLTFGTDSGTVVRARLTTTASDQALRPVGEFVREALWCDADTSIREAAQRMTEAGHSCVVFAAADGIGIMTDSDCRRRVATGEVPIDAPVTTIGTAPVRTVESATPASKAFVEMVMHGVHHLVVVDTGGRVVGVTRVMDLSSVEIRDPLIIRSAIDRATTLEELVSAARLLPPTAVELCDAGVPALRAGALIGAMVEAIVERCISIDDAFVDHDQYDVSWLVLGSLARREPLPSSDVDTALVWTPREEREASLVQARLPGMADSAETVIQRFERCGLRRCVEGANASNRLFNRSSTAWVAAAQAWIADPDREGALLLSSMVTDCRALTGVALGRQTIDSIGRLTTTKRFLKRMLDEALLRRPPTGFVRDFVVEANGRHRGQLNLKKGGLSPVVGIGRWIAVTTRMPAGSTQDRLARGAESGLLTQDESDTLRAAHREMFELLFAREVDALRDSRTATLYLDPKELDSLTRRHLRESFRAIAHVQSRLEGEWLSRIR